MMIRDCAARLCLIAPALQRAARATVWAESRAVGNRFAATANFGKASAGVYLASIPAKAFKQFEGAAAPARQ